MSSRIVGDESLTESFRASFFLLPFFQQNPISDSAPSPGRDGLVRSVRCLGRPWDALGTPNGTASNLNVSGPWDGGTPFLHPRREKATSSPQGALRSISYFRIPAAAAG